MRLRVPTQQRDLETLTRQLEEALRFDTATGLLKRAVFFEQATAQAAQTLKAGLRAIVYLEPDSLARCEGELGPLAVEDLIEGVGQQLRSQLQPGDMAGRITSRGFAVLVERGNTRDLDAWIGARAAAHVRARVPRRRAVRLDHLQRGRDAAERPRRGARRAAAGGDQGGALPRPRRRQPAAAARAGRREAGARRGRPRLGHAASSRR